MSAISTSGSEELTGLGEARRLRRRWLKTIGQRASLGRGNPIMDDLLVRERARYLSSPTVQAITCYDILRRRGDEPLATRTWQALKRPPIVPARYTRLGVRPVEWFNMPRMTSGARKICRFGLTEAMWHRLSADLIVAQHRPRPHIGDWPDRGRDRQIDGVIEAIHSPAQAVVVADVRRCFASVNAEAIYELPYVPEALIRGALDHRTHSFVRKEKDEYAPQLRNMASRELEAAPSGLMEGSPASNAVFAVMMDDLPDHLGEGVTPFLYCDNIVVIAPNIERALSAECALVRYFTDHRAGPFELTTCTQPVTRPFDHLGYDLCWGDEGVDVRLSPRNYDRLCWRLGEEENDLDDTTSWLRGSFGKLTHNVRSTYEDIIADEKAHRLARRHSVVRPIN